MSKLRPYILQIKGALNSIIMPIQYFIIVKLLKKKINTDGIIFERKIYSKENGKGEIDE